ncbi:hypothetical protein Avbf_17573 [Armadillidium vulgare]|nr:hypothetical protein Avbf_17573 [Armadillidium vulgare]
MENMISKGYHKEFVGSTFEMYKYLNCLLQNISEDKKTVSSEVQLVLDIFILFQRTAENFPFN